MENQDEQAIDNYTCACGSVDFNVVPWLAVESETLIMDKGIPLAVSPARNTIFDVICSQCGASIGQIRLSP
jgi:hypothetical protein